MLTGWGEDIVGGSEVYLEGLRYNFGQGLRTNLANLFKLYAIGDWILVEEMNIIAGILYTQIGILGKSRKWVIGILKLIESSFFFIF